MTTQQIDKRHFHVYAVAAFVFCFLGVALGNDVLIVDVLALTTGAAIGLSAARTIKRMRPPTKPNAVS